MNERLHRRAFLIVLLAIGMLCVANPASGQVKTAAAEPTMKLQGLDGRVYDMADQRGNVVLVSFGATWCAPCNTELRALEELLTEYRDKPVKFFWVSVERPEEVSNSALKRYAKDRKVSFPVLRNPAKRVFFHFSQRVRLPRIFLLVKNAKVSGPAQLGIRSPAKAS